MPKNYVHIKSLDYEKTIKINGCEVCIDFFACRIIIRKMLNTIKMGLR